MTVIIFSTDKRVHWTAQHWPEVDYNNY